MQSFHEMSIQDYIELAQTWKEELLSQLPLTVFYGFGSYQAQWIKINWGVDKTTLDDETSHSSKTIWRMELEFTCDSQTFTQKTLNQYWFKKKYGNHLSVSGTTPYHGIFVRPGVSLNDFLPWRERCTFTDWELRIENMGHCISMLRDNPDKPRTEIPISKERQKKKRKIEERKKQDKTEKDCVTCLSFFDCIVFCALCGNHGCEFCRGRICAHCQPWSALQNPCYHRLMEKLEKEQEQDQETEENKTEERRRLYKKLALVLHPDKHPNEFSKYHGLFVQLQTMDLQGLQKLERQYCK